MNKRKTCLFVLLAVLVLAIVCFMVRPDSSQEYTQGSDVAVSTDPSAIPADPASTVPDAAVETTEPQETQIPTEDSNLETNVQPEGDETLPPEVDAIMGVVKDNEGGIGIEGGQVSNSGNASQSQKPNETKPEEYKPAETIPHAKPSTGSTTDPLSDNYDLTTLTYEGYMAMNGEQQKAVIGWFASPDVFVKWFNAVEAQYKAEHPEIEIGPDGSVDLG